MLVVKCSAPALAASLRFFQFQFIRLVILSTLLCHVRTKRTIKWK